MQDSLWNWLIDGNINPILTTLLFIVLIASFVKKSKLKELIASWMDISDHAKQNDKVIQNNIDSADTEISKRLARNHLSKNIISRSNNQLITFSRVIIGFSLFALIIVKIIPSPSLTWMNNILTTIIVVLITLIIIYIKFYTSKTSCTSIFQININDDNGQKGQITVI